MLQGEGSENVGATGTASLACPRGGYAPGPLLVRTQQGQRAAPRREGGHGVREGRRGPALCVRARSLGPPPLVLSALRLIAGVSTGLRLLWDPFQPV